MNRKKTILTATVLLLVILIGGMLAYFTDTETRTNVFTVGNIHIQLNEDTWARSTGTEYTRPEANNITPNKKISKNPTIKNIGKDGKGNDAYVFLKVEVPNAEVTVNGVKAVQDLYTLDNLNSNWAEIDVTDVTGNGVHVYAYGTTSVMTPLEYNNTTAPLFTSVTLKNLDEQSELDSLTTPNIKITAYGIQTTDLGVTAPTAIFALCK